jgi:outer membrane autotransporter protein
MVVGYDAAVGSDFIFGVSGSESSPEIQLDDASSLTTSRLLHVGFYGNYNRSNSRVGAMVGLGNWNNNSSRDVTDGVTFSKAKAEYGGYGIFSHLEYGRLFEVGKSVIVEPQVGLQLTRASLDGFTEDGAGALNLMVPDRRMVSKKTRLGVRATSALPFGSALHLMVEGRAAWAHELNPLGGVTVRFAGDTATGGFDLQAPELARNSALVGASLVGSSSRRLQFFASVGSEINRTVSGWTGDAGVRAGW